MKKTLKAGAASVVINNDIGTMIQGAGVPDQRVEAIHDDLEANALYLDDGQTRLLFITCDLVNIETDRNRIITEAIAADTGLDANTVIIGSSHTHGGPVMMHTNYQKPIDETYFAKLVNWLRQLAANALANASPARLGWGIGNARVGYNRRVCYSDNTHAMYRQQGLDNDFTGAEGPDDTATLVLAVFNDDNTPRAILHHGTGHPTAFYGQRFLSADYPGLARRLLREAYQSPLPVLFYNGAEGDIGMPQQMWPQQTVENTELKVYRFGTALAGETLRLLHEMCPQSEVSLTHHHTTLDLPVRLPAPEAVAAGRAVLARCEAGEKVSGNEAIFAWGPVLLHNRFAKHPFDSLPFHAIRINDLLLATQPFELFCQYQLDIKRRSPTQNTIIFGLTGGSGGYLPTLAAALGGGYSGVPFAWARFEPAVGCKVVDTLSNMLHQLWKKES